MNKMSKLQSILVKTLIILMLTLCVSIPNTESVSAATTQTAKAEINSVEGAYLRKGPSTSTQKLALLKHKTKITIIREHYVTSKNANIVYRWYNVQVGKKKGYVRADLVKNISYSPRAAWTKDNLNFRIGAGTNMTRKGTYKKGAKINVVLEAKPYKSNQIWYRVKDGKNYYYVSGEWITFSKPKNASTTAAKVSSQSLASKTKQSAASKKVAQGAVAWAIKISNDDSFHYGNGQHAHHNGCYFCGTQPASKQKNVVKWQKTYCCNPFVHAAYAHGGKESKMLKMCQRGRSYDWNSYKVSPLFKHIGHPAMSELSPGDVLCWDGHVAMYVSPGKIVEAGGYGEDDGKYLSKKWKNSIAVTPLDTKTYNMFTHVYRYIGAN